MPQRHRNRAAHKRGEALHVVIDRVPYSSSSPAHARSLRADKRFEMFTGSSDFSISTVNNNVHSEGPTIININHNYQVGYAVRLNMQPMGLHPVFHPTWDSIGLTDIVALLLGRKLRKWHGHGSGNRRFVYAPRFALN